MMANEKSWRSEDEIKAGLREIWEAMQSCIQRGIRQTGTLPGGLHVSRRAPALYEELSSRPEAAMRDPLTTQIGRAHVSTPVTNAHLVCRILLVKKKHTHKNNMPI